MVSVLKVQTMFFFALAAKNKTKQKLRWKKTGAETIFTLLVNFTENYKEMPSNKLK